MTDQLAQLAERVGDALMWRSQTLAVAESCTGGWIAKCLTDVPGASAWFERGYVTYSTESKTDCLGVPQALMIEHGTVSEAVAKAEALGALRRARTDWALGVTGVAGPGGATAAKPVGLVHFCWCSPEQTLTHQEVIAGGRDRVRAGAVALALEGLIQLLESDR